MVTMHIKLNEEYLATSKCKYTKEYMEKRIRAFFAKWNGEEIAPLVFQRDDALALGAFGNFFSFIMDDDEFTNCLAECWWDVDGHRENCLKAVKEVMRTIVM